MFLGAFAHGQMSSCVGDLAGMFQHMAIQEKKVPVAGRMNQCNIPNIPRFCFILFIFLYSIYAVL